MQNIGMLQFYKAGIGMLPFFFFSEDFVALVIDSIQTGNGVRHGGETCSWMRTSEQETPAQLSDLSRTLMSLFFGKGL